MREPTPANIARAIDLFRKSIDQLAQSKPSKAEQERLERARRFADAQEIALRARS